MRHHARLRHREGQECADREKRDQSVGDAAESNEQDPGGNCQIQYADREHEPAPDDGKRPRQEIVLGNQAAHPRKIDEARIGGEAQHAQHAADRDIIKNAAADDCAGQLRKDALISLLRLVHRADLIGMGKIGDAGEQHPEYRHDRGQGTMGGLDHRLTERADAVADRLDPGHRRATGRERPQQQPDADRFAAAGGSAAAAPPARD